MMIKKNSRAFLEGNVIAYGALDYELLVRYFFVQFTKNQNKQMRHTARLYCYRGSDNLVVKEVDQK